MNHLFWPTAMLAGLLFWAGTAIGSRLSNPHACRAFLLVAGLLAVPGVLFAFHYTKLMGEPIWFYEFRAAPFTELTAAGAGLLAGYTQQSRLKVPFLKKQLRRFTLPILFALMLTVPYLKPLLRPLHVDQLNNEWQGTVCMQSTPATCGPASAATLLLMLGHEASEAELARDSLTYAGGTENWYLVRALRQRGFSASYFKADPDRIPMPAPSIAGVRLTHGTGHFVTVLSREADRYTIGDPLKGEVTGTLAELQHHYTFTGFFLLIE